MPNDLTPHKTPPAAKQRRMSAPVRRAIDLYITNGMSKADAAREVGISEGHLYNYLMKPHAKAYELERKVQYIQDVEEMKAPYKSQAFEVARDLMHNAKSEAVRMRAVEFFAGEHKNKGFNVAVQVNNHTAGGYEYVQPGQQIVEITPVTDTKSDSVAEQEPEK
jgi:transposase